MTGPATRAEFAVLLRRAGFDLPEAEIDDLFVGWGHVEPMLHRIRGDAARGREAEPALVFRPDAYTDDADTAEDAGP